jgi:hypothetical protein
MANLGDIRLELVDAGGSRIRESVDVMIRHLTTGRRLLVRNAPASKIIRIPDLSAAPDGLHLVEVDPPSYLSSGRFVNVRSDGPTRITMPFAIDAQKVREAVFPAYGALDDDGRRILAASDQVLGFEGRSAAALYDALDDLRRAGLLNILAKARATPLVNGRTVITYLEELKELRGDRFFARVPQELREETKQSAQEGLFDAAPDLLHHPPPGLTHAGSFKTRDHYGNLQLTFFAGGGDWVADVDIDDAGGLEHVFQVVRNELTGRPTHPYDIHDILVRHQHLEPGYALVV